MGNGINPLVPEAHYSERQDKAFLYQFNDLKLN